MAKCLQNFSASIANLIWLPNLVCRHILHIRAVALINAMLLYVEVTLKFQKGTKLKSSDVCLIMKLVKGIQWVHVERIWEMYTSGSRVYICIKCSVFILDYIICYVSLANIPHVFGTSSTFIWKYYWTYVGSKVFAKFIELMWKS